MNTMRKAMQLARDVIAGFIEGADPDCGEPDCGDCKAYRPAWAALPAIDAALAEPVPQPVAWKAPNSRKVISHDDREHMLSMRKVGGEFQSAAWLAESYSIPLYAAPVAAPAPAQIGDEAIRLRAVANRLLHALEDIHGSGSCYCVAQSNSRCVFCEARAVLAAEVERNMP